MLATPLYDDFDDYDRFVNWPSRLAYELPFIEKQLASVGARRVLDTACGTGMHAIALARAGYDVTGSDVSVGMIERARQNAAAAGIQVAFAVAGFGEVAAQVGGGFDAVLCLGNSLPHALTPAALAAALADFRVCLRPGGLLLVQNRNLDAVLMQRERWMEPQAHRDGDREWLFIRFYDFHDDGLLTFNVMTLRRQGEGDWQQQVSGTQLWPQRQAELAQALAAAGFADITSWGDMQGAPFVAATSPNLIITARSAHLKKE